MIDTDCFFIFKNTLCLGVHPSRILRKSKPKGKVCLLPGCKKITYHNGGYCCAEHCKDHKSILKHGMMRN